MAARSPAPPRIVAAAMLAVAGSGLVVGCAESEGYPSLARRPIETLSLAEPAAPAAGPATDATAADARFAPALRRVREDDAAFMRAAGATRDMLTRGRRAQVGSDAWTDAQEAYSRLSRYRELVAASAAAIEAEIEAPAAQADAGIAAAARRAAAEAGAIDAREAETLRRLAPDAP